MIKSDILDAISIQKKMLQITGCWPQRKKTFFYKCRQCVLWLIDFTFFITLLIELRLNLTEQDYKHLTELISFMASEVSYIIKNFIFLMNSNRFIEAVEKVKNNNFKNYPYQADKHVKSSTKYAKILMRCYQMLVSSLVLMYLLKPFFTKDKSALRFVAYDLGQWLIVFHLYQVFSIGLACWNNSSLDILALGMISIGAAQFEILRDKLLNARRWAGFTNDEIDEGKENETEEMDEALDGKIVERLKECVKHHLDIIEYVAAIESIYTYYFLIQFFDSVLAICNTWFQFMMADDLLNILFLIAYSATLMIQLGIYCVYGNNLMLKSEEIRDACYLSDWYKCDLKVRRMLMIIMERSKRPSVLTAGKFSVLGLAAFSNLLQSSYSYFALMNHLNGK